MTGVLIKGDVWAQTCIQEDGHVKTETKLGVMLL